MRSLLPSSDSIMINQGGRQLSKSEVGDEVVSELGEQWSKLGADFTLFVLPSMSPSQAIALIQIQHLHPN